MPVFLSSCTTKASKAKEIFWISFMKHHELVYLFILCTCAASNLCQWRSLFAWALFMTGNTWPGTVKRLKKLIGIWIGALGHYSDIGKKLAKQGNSFAKWASDQLRVRLARFDKRHSNKTDCQVIWQGLDTHSLGRAECWTQAEVLREPPVLEEKPGSAPKWGDWAHFLILNTYCTAVEGTEWHQGSTWRCDIVWTHLSSGAALSTFEMTKSENYSL